MSVVRVAEGSVLHPVRGPDGVRFFDPTEVDALVGRPLGRRAHGIWFRRRFDSRCCEPKLRHHTERDRDREELDALRREKAELRLAIGGFIGLVVP